MKSIGITEDFFKMKMVVKTSTTKEHFKGAIKYIDLFLDKYKDLHTPIVNNFWFHALVIRKETFRDYIKLL